MRETRYQVFVSSTFRDLEAERSAVISLIQSMNHIPAGMELFPSANDTPWDVIKRVIKGSDYYVLVIGGKYGSTNADGISFTEAEYDYAVEKELPILPFLHGAPDEIPTGKAEMDGKARKKLDLFRQRVEEQHTCSYWSSAEGLKGKVAVSLVREISTSPRTGWVRGNIAEERDNLLQEINGLQRTVTQLREENESLNRRVVDVNTSHLAQGDDEVELEYKLAVKASDVWTTETESTTWQRILTSLGPFLIPAKAESAVEHHLNQIIQHLIDPEQIGHQARISKPSFESIRTQFLALRLIDVVEEEREQRMFVGPGGREEGAKMLRQSVWHLTPHGKFVVSESLAARRT